MFRGSQTSTLTSRGRGEGYSVSRSVGIMCHWHCESLTLFNPFTPESDQCQNSPVASQEIWHHTVWRTWLFIAYSDEKWLYYKFSLHHSYNHFLKGWENTLFELRSKRVKRAISWLWYPAQEYLCWFRILFKTGPQSRPYSRDGLFLLTADNESDERLPKWLFDAHRCMQPKRACPYVQGICTL